MIFIRTSTILNHQFNFISRTIWMLKHFAFFNNNIICCLMIGVSSLIVLFWQIGLLVAKRTQTHSAHGNVIWCCYPNESLILRCWMGCCLAGSLNSLKLTCEPLKPNNQLNEHFTQPAYYDTMNRLYTNISQIK